MLCVAASVSYFYLSNDSDVQAFSGTCLSTLKETCNLSITKPLDFDVLTDSWNIENNK